MLEINICAVQKLRDVPISLILDPGPSILAKGSVMTK